MKIIKEIEDYFWNNIKHLLLLLGSIAILFFVWSYFTDDSKLSSILKDIGTVIVAGAIFQFILKSKGFIKVIDETFDHTKRQWEKYNFDYIKRLLNTIKEAHSFFEFDFNKTKFESIEKAKADYIEMSEVAKKDTRTKDKEQLLRRNFYIKELTSSRTIYKNGCEIVSFNAVIEIIKDGEFVFNYNISLSNPDNKFPDFVEFNDITKNHRFSDFSFSSKILNLPDNLSNPTLQIEATEDSEITKKIKMTLPDTLLKGDTFNLLFSFTTKDEYTEDYLKNIKTAKNPPSSSSSYPIGVRHFIIQEEHYGEDNSYNYLLNPKVFVEESEIVPLKTCENLFYKTTQWSIYYSEIKEGTVKLSLV
ncbi:MAG: hypothetical protein U9R37_02985 [Campylobacterota bacterium]|nr:hypothetical protein [Campylobacterota bacterium]